MGLYVHSLAELPNTIDNKNYFIYILDYGWKEPLSDVLRDNFQNMARKASETKSVVIAGTDPIHFANEVFSYHSINGEDGNLILPAIMISTLTPSYFLENNHNQRNLNKYDDTLIIIPLRNTCQTTDDIIQLINSIFSDIQQQKQLTKFNIITKITKQNNSRFFDSLILEPNFNGVGIDLKKLFKMDN